MPRFALFTKPAAIAGSATSEPQTARPRAATRGRELNMTSNQTETLLYSNPADRATIAEGTDGEDQAARRLCEVAIENYRRWLEDYASDPECFERPPKTCREQVTTRGYVLGEEGALEPGISMVGGDSLYELRWEFSGATILSRSKPDEATEALAAFSTPNPPESQIGFAPCARHWAILLDRRTAVPLTWQAKDFEARVREWRDSIRDLRGAELIAIVSPGHELAFVVWFDVPRTDAEVRAWAHAMSGPTAEDDEPRFAPVRYPWRSPDDAEAIYLPAERAPVLPALPSRREVLGTASARGRHLTGIPELDRQFRAGGLPTDARIVLAAPKGSMKTTIALAIAEHWLAAGGCVLWIALDESPGSITARQLQYRGLSPARAAELPEDAVAAIPDRFAVVGEGYLEDLWELAHGSAVSEGAPLLVVTDSLQRLLSRAGEGKGERERLEETLAAVERCQARWPALWLTTSEATAGGEAKGARAIGYAATIELALSRAGDAVSVRVPKNRHGSEDGFRLRVDRDRQQIISEAQAKAAQAEAELLAQIKEALTEHGPMARTKIETWVKADSRRVRAALSAMVAAGTLALEGQRYTLRLQ